MILLLVPRLIREFNYIHDFLGEICVPAFKRVHNKSIVSQEVHSTPMVDYLRPRNIC